ncbi:MAG: TolC family protein [Thiobacillus sp.]
MRFASLAALTEHALRTRADSRAAWLGILAEAARLDAASAANWPTLTGQFNFIQSRALSSSGASAPTLNRYGPSLGLTYVLYDFGARTASIDAQRYQLIAALLNGDRALQDAVAEVETAYFAVLAARADQPRARRPQRSDAGASAGGAGYCQGRSHAETGGRQRADAAAAARLGNRAAGRTGRRDPAGRPCAGGALAEPALAANTGRTFFLEDERTPSTTYSVGVNLSAPLFDGGRLAAQARAAERDAERLQAEAESQRSQVALAVTAAYHDVRHAQDRRAGVTVQFEVAIVAQASGTVLRQHVQEGDQVRAGELQAGEAVLVEIPKRLKEGGKVTLEGAAAEKKP